MKWFDIVFKVVLIGLLSCFLFLFSQSYRNGRYINISQYGIADTHTGKMYLLNGDTYNPVSSNN